jgi:hypothetical protein
MIQYERKELEMSKSNKILWKLGISRVGYITTNDKWINFEEIKR